MITKIRYKYIVLFINMFVSHIQDINSDLKDIDKFSLNNEKISTFGINDYLDDILKSYKYNNKRIREQFNVDIPRTNVKINGRLVNNINELEDKFRKYKHDNINIKEKSYNFITVLLAICTQSSFFLPYYLFYKLYSEKTKDYMVCSIIDRGNVILDISDINITVELKGVFALKSISSNKLVGKIDMSLTFGFNIMEAYYLLYSTRSIDVIPSGMIFWDFC